MEEGRYKQASKQLWGKKEELINAESPCDSINQINISSYLQSLLLNLSRYSTLRLPPSTNAMKVTIKQWNAIATWRWDMPDDEVCGICRVQFDGTCPTCKFPGDDCSLCMSPPISKEYIYTNQECSTREMRPFIPYG